MVGVGLQIDSVVADGLRVMGSMGHGWWHWQYAWVVGLCGIVAMVFGTIIVVARYWWGCWVMGLMGHKWSHWPFVWVVEFFLGGCWALWCGGGCLGFV